MTVKELRIGNYVLNGYNKPFQIEGIISEGNTGGYRADTLKPIALNEKWLFKLGFADDTPEYCKNNTNSYWQGRYNYVYIGKKPEARFFRIYRLPESEWDKTDIRGHKFGEYMFYASQYWVMSVKYVHELQNLLFILTGEEFIVNNQ